ncbi:MAG: hypothetical protein WC451_00500 [Patescibacteria group bacterium]
MKKTIAYVISGIILTIFSGALYDFVVKPNIFMLAKCLVNYVNSFNDETYLIIAKSFHEQSASSLWITTLISLAWLLLWLSIVLIITGYFRHSKSPNRILKYVESVPTTKLRWIMFVLSCLLFAISLFGAAQHQYINDAITYYQQLRAIDAPFISEIQLKEYDSKFAQIKNKSDYIIIINSLEEISDTNKQTHPIFQP